MNKGVSTSNLIMDQKCKGAKERIAEVKVVHPEVEREEIGRASCRERVFNWV